MSEGFPNRPAPRPFQPRVPNNNGFPDNPNNTVVNNRNNNPVNVPRPVPQNAGNVSNARNNGAAVRGNGFNPQRPGVAPLRPAVPLHDGLRRVNEGGSESNAGMQGVRRPVLRPFGDESRDDGVSGSDARRKDGSARRVEQVERAADEDSVIVRSGDEYPDDSGVIVRSVGQRGKDRFPREHRVARGLFLTPEQVDLIDRLNMRRLNRDIRAKSFTLTREDRFILDYLVRARFATLTDVGRVGGWSDSYMKTRRRLHALEDVGLIKVDRVPFENYVYIMATQDGLRLSGYGYLGIDNDMDVLRAYRGHAFGLSSLASHLMNRRKDADEVERDLLGVGEDEYTAIRKEILSGKSHVVMEREYRSAWKRVRETAGRSPSALTEANYRHGMETLYMEAHEDKGNVRSRLTGQTFEYYCTNPDYRGDMAWLWIVYGNDIVYRDNRGGYRVKPVDNAAIDDKGRPVLVKANGDLFSTQDHCPDMVVCRPRDLSSGRPGSIAVELELSAKTKDEYMRIMFGYMSKCGRLLYRMVVWQVVNAALANIIRAGAGKAGAVEGRDYVIVPVHSGDVKQSFNYGADMVPGAWKDGDEAKGYTIAKALMEGTYGK